MAGPDRARAIWLDITRLATRAGRGVLTGIDRVELAWLSHLLDENAPATRYVLRSTRGYLLLDHRGARKLAAILKDAEDMGRADRVSRLLGKGSEARHRIEGTLRRLAVDRALPWSLPGLIARAAGGPIIYLNTGHSNLSKATLGAFGAAPMARVAVLIHDLIPLTHPELVARGMPDRFAGRIARVQAEADLVICNSAATQGDLAAHWQTASRRPPSIVAHLGVDRPQRADAPRDPRRFVMLGTIEPRKNHALMLDVWDRLAAELPVDRMPDLHIIGPTGWRVEALMDRLAAHPLRGRSIHLHGALPDAEVQAHLARATALLFPSLAEGYGYPPLEVALTGTLPICSNLPALQENLGKSAVYLDTRDPQAWLETIKQHVLGNAVLPSLPLPKVPGWPAHFEKVGRALEMI
jgi:glycosyltransferase involved in cell wall biosynthesis